METIKSVYKGNLRSEATHLESGAIIFTDAPKDNQGKGEAFSPTDLLAASLGSCMLTIMAIAARTHGFNVDNTDVSITKIMGANPRRVAEIVLEFRFPRDYDERQKRLIEAAARECPVGRSLHPDLKQTISFVYPSKEKH